MNRVLVGAACALCLIFLALGPVSARAAATDGWWWDPAYSGVGFSLSRDGGNLYVAYYAYESSGEPVWYSALAQAGSDGVYRGSFLRYTQASTPELYCRLKLDFTGTDQASLRLYAEDDNQPSLDVRFELVKFLPMLDAGEPDPRGLSGWFWDPADSGRGFYVEALGQTLYMAWYTYGEDGEPHWYAMGAGTQDPAFDPGADSYSAQVLEYSGGYDGHEFSDAVPQAAGGVGRLDFTGSGDDLRIDFTWQGTTQTLEPFPFADIELPSTERSFYTAGDSWSVVPAAYGVFQAWLDQNDLNFTARPFAVAGSTAAQWADASSVTATPLLNALVTDERPDPVVYMTLGVNDAAGGGDADDIPVDLARVLTRILDARPDARIILASMDTLNPTAMGCEYLGDVLTLNTGLDALAQAQGQVAADYPRVYAAYVMGTLQGTPGSPDLTQPCDAMYLGDCVHLNQAGYTLVVGQALDGAYAETFFMD